MSSLRTGLVLLSLLILVITLALHSTSPLVPSSLSTQPLNFPPLLHPPPPLTCTKTHCLPNFLILGAGKSGTSSLYTYLTSHPLILPALHKQIHYYKYYYTKGISWYRSKFPTRKQLEDADAVMTGEAAPGYLPYPYVADRIYKDFGRSNVKLLIVVRHPTDRAYSSYRYNYLSEVAAGSPVPFVEFIRAEIDYLQGTCLNSNGLYEKAASNEPFNGAGARPAGNLIQGCYEFDNADAIRKRTQWAKLIESDGAYNLRVPNQYLYAALIGRGLYSYQIEWYVKQFDAENVMVVCSEDLKERTAATMAEVAAFVGVGSEEVDWEKVVSVGMFNVGGENKGYTKVTKWEDVAKEPSEEVPEEARLLMEPIVRMERDRMEEMRRSGMYVGKDCNWM